MPNEQNLQEQKTPVLDGQGKPSEPIDGEDQENEGEDKPLTPEDIKTLRAEVKEAKEETERLKKEQLDTKTSPRFLDKLRKQRDEATKVRITNPNMPTARPTRTAEEYDNMTGSQIMQEINESNRKLYAQITKDKIQPMVTQQEVDVISSEISQGFKDYPEARAYEGDMKAVAMENAGLDFTQALTLVAQQKGDRVLLDKILGGKKEEVKEDKAHEKKAKEAKEAKAGIGERPASNVAGTIKTQKKMTPREAALAAFETTFEGKGG